MLASHAATPTCTQVVYSYGATTSNCVTDIQTMVDYYNVNNAAYAASGLTQAGTGAQFGTNTEANVKFFQQSTNTGYAGAHFVAADLGEVDSATWTAFCKPIVRVGIPTSAFLASMKDACGNTNAYGDCYATAYTLNAKSVCVSDIQTMINYYNSKISPTLATVTVNGTYTSATSTAVKHFQQGTNTGYAKTTFTSLGVTNTPTWNALCKPKKKVGTPPTSLLDVMQAACGSTGIYKTVTPPPPANVPAGITLGASYETTFSQMPAATQASEIALMKADGVKWLRVDVFSVPGVTSTLIQDAEASGINVDAILQDWSKTSTPTPAASAAYATQAVDYFKTYGVNTYEVLNEVNGCEEPMDAATYTAILKANYTAIHAADSKAFVLSAGLCPALAANEPYNYLTAMYADGVAGYFDAFNLHPYSHPDTPLQTTYSYNPWSYLPQLHNIMVANGDGNKQIWLTEFGCMTPPNPSGDDCTDATEGTYITDGFAAARATTYVGPLFIFNWRDSGDGPWGLYTSTIPPSTGAPKTPALDAYQTAASQ